MPPTPRASGRRARTPPFLAVLFAVAASSTSPGLSAHDLTFRERVEAQRAIERVYYIHRTGSARRFEEAVPEAVLERKVRTYLAESVALEDFWNTPVTAVMLRREVDRMTAGSRLPERLAEIRAALGGDDRLLAETLARATLADRLCRAFLAADSRVATHDWDSWWASAAPRFDPYRARTVVQEMAAPTSTAAPASFAEPATTSKSGQATLDAASCTFQDLWAAGQERDFPAILADPMVWTGSEVIFWDGNGGRYDPATDSWHPTNPQGAPSPRFGHTAVWTGSEMIVWGGVTAAMQYLNTGGRYDPVADAWTPIATSGAPPATAHHLAVWTGSKMVVWGGVLQSQGGRYDPARDTWQSISPVGAPTGTGATLAKAVWTGTEMIVWGGFGPGARYDPKHDRWSPVSQVNAPHPRGDGHSQVWTGSRMLIWGGENGGFAPDAGLYDPSTDSWTPVSLAGAPTNRYDHATVWTGTEMIVWGGYDFTNSGPHPAVSTGGRYNPATDTWQPTSDINTPPATSAIAVWTGDLMVTFGSATSLGGRYRPATDSWTPVGWPPSHAPHYGEQPASVWTGAEMIVWANPDPGGGGRYDPTTDTWTPTSTIGAPSARTKATSVWTGSEMIVWGGESGTTPLDTGARYRPLTDTWTPTSTIGAPSARTKATSVWTGSEMIVWGGESVTTPLGTGGRYRPLTDTWATVANSGAPSPRTGHTAVWTGKEMVIWGGVTPFGPTETGARFDPAADGGAGAWRATTLTGAPVARSGHTAVWTGSEMIVWGGSSSTGARYDPVADEWTPTSTVNTPTPRFGHSAVWTGDQMIIWGGASSGVNGYVSYDDGHRYDPVSNTWTLTSWIGRPSPRAYQSSAWTGSAMLVWDGAWWNGSLVTGISDPSIHWYGNTAATPPPDLDGDGVNDCLDCDNGNPAAWNTPGEVADLMFGGDGVTLTWSPPANPGATSVAYDLLRSDVASDFLSAGVCVASGIPDPSAADASTPGLGNTFFYLARARNACPGGVGTVGAGTGGAPRTALVCP